MNRIAAKFDEIKRDERKGFIPFVTAGDPDLETSLDIVLTLAECGADVIELGVPFSDPMADGPTIQRSSARALAGGTSFHDVLDLSAKIRERTDIPLVLFTYFNPFLRFGIEEFCRTDSGIDGVLLTDVIEDEADLISCQLGDNGIDLISLAAPTTTDQRLKKICTDGRGFIYVVSRAGVTGAQRDTSSEAKALVARVRQFTELPVAVGFGISTAEQVADVWRYADAAVVGSAIVSEIEHAQNAGDAVRRVEEIVGRLLPQFAKTSGEN
ncbi:tryptophan synthase subunit alpha [soil metagenome]